MRRHRASRRVASLTNVPRVQCAGRAVGGAGPAGVQGPLRGPRTRAAEKIDARGTKHALLPLLLLPLLLLLLVPLRRGGGAGVHAGLGR
jgi:hypothetical protein